jgi:ABC-type molybdate transport system substrate-binding protein
MACSNPRQPRRAIALDDRGAHGRAALESLGVWQAVEPHVARADNVRAALALVARGEAPLGVVYRSDALADDSIKVVGDLPEDNHPSSRRIPPPATRRRTPHRITKP